MSNTRRFVAWTAGLTLMVAGCSSGSSDRPGVSPLPVDAGGPVGLLAANALVPFDACESFLDYMVTHGVELVGPYGFGGQFYAVADDLARDGGAVTTMAEAAAGADIDFSGTNVQVEGVDEPDVVKTDGRRVVLLVDGHLIVADVTGDEPVVTGRLRLDGMSVQTLLLAGDKALLFGSGWEAVPFAEAGRDIAPVPGSATLQMVEVDIAADPRIVRTMAVDGRFVSARMVGDVVRLVLGSSPVGFDWHFPSGSGLRAEREATEANRDLVRNSTADNWIPYYVVTDGERRVTDEGRLFGCERASRPPEFSGLDMLTVVTIDLSTGLHVSDAAAVVATGDMVYASTGSLYVATQPWQVWSWSRLGTLEPDRPDQVFTEIHKFDISRAGAASYVASGKVEGFLLNQFSMDEHRGFLRVASTTSPVWWGDEVESQSMVTVLEEHEGELRRIGVVDGLGETERIYSVRFLDEVAYVVTFRQVDPLYTVDLSDPTRPRVVGELKILGYSAYLHPVGDGLILGVGQDATEAGQVRGTQMSLFDVSDPANPTRIGQVTLDEGSSSEVEYDHHAFLYWPGTGLAVVPVQQWWWEEREDKESAFFGAVALQVDSTGGLSELARLTHPGGGEGEARDWRAHIIRSIVIGDSLYTISPKGIMKSHLGTLERQAWLDF